MGLQTAMAQMSFNVLYPQGVAWRGQPNYDARITNIAGPACGTMITGKLIQGDVQYCAVHMPNGQQLFVPVTSPDGQHQLLAACQGMQQQLSQDVYRVQQQYNGGMSSKEMKKMKKQKGGKHKKK